MLISISDSVSLDVSGTEAAAAATEGLCGDLKAGDLETPFFLMLPHRKLKLSFSEVCHSVLFSAACPDFISVSLPYLVH